MLRGRKPGFKMGLVRASMPAAVRRQLIETVEHGKKPDIVSN
jgi:hypothetical protein